MPVVKRGPRALSVILLLSVGAGSAAAVAAEPWPSLDGKDLAQGPYSAMHMILQKTFLKIDVATIDLRFDRQTQARFAELARGKPYSDALAQRLAQVAMGAAHAVVQMQFKHDVSLDRWMGVVRESLEQARAAGLLTAELARRVSEGLPARFAALRARGYEKGDRLLYDVKPDALHTVVVSAAGQTLLDGLDREGEVARVVLPSYFAPTGDFRGPLLHSLLETNVAGSAPHVDF
jgi:hypothetical protein